MLRKKLKALVLVIALLCLQGIVLAERCPLPAVNTDAEITFSGFEWYTDYKTTLAVATKNRFVNKYDWSSRAIAYETNPWNFRLFLHPIV